MVSIKRLILAALFLTGAAIGIVGPHGVTVPGASVTPTHLHLAGDTGPNPPG